jgi:tetratricopeptide (TPR) repeat protein
MQPDLDQTALDRAAQDRQPDDRREHLGEERDDVDVQDSHVPFFDRLRRLVPGPPPAGPLGRGVAHLERGRLDAADDAFAEALASAAGDAEIALARNKRALVALRRGDRHGALVELAAALDAQPHAACAITTLGNLLLEDGCVDDAIAHYRAALAADDGYAPAYHNLGVALHRSGRRPEAVRMLRKAARVEGRRR